MISRRKLLGLIAALPFGAVAARASGLSTCGDAVEEIFIKRPSGITGITKLPARFMACDFIDILSPDDWFVERLARLRADPAFIEVATGRFVHRDCLKHSRPDSDGTFSPVAPELEETAGLVNVKGYDPPDTA